MRFPCSKHDDRESVLIAGRNYCSECMRVLDREVIVEWAHHSKPELTRVKTLQLLEELFGTKDFGFSSFPTLYARWPRETMKVGRKEEFVLSQIDYLQNAFLCFVRDKNVQAR